jgi:hypothetical protein
MTTAYKILIRKPKEKRTLGTPRGRWGMILKCVKWNGCEAVGWIHLDQDREGTSN